MPPPPSPQACVVQIGRKAAFGVVHQMYQLRWSRTPLEQESTEEEILRWLPFLLKEIAIIGPKVSC